MPDPVLPAILHDPILVEDIDQRKMIRKRHAGVMLQITAAMNLKSGILTILNQVNLRIPRTQNQYFLHCQLLSSVVMRSAARFRLCSSTHTARHAPHAIIEIIIASLNFTGAYVNTK